MRHLAWVTFDVHGDFHRLAHSLALRVEFLRQRVTGDRLDGYRSLPETLLKASSSAQQLSTSESWQI